MSVPRFKSFLAEQPNLKFPNGEWSVRWLKRIFEFFDQPAQTDLAIDTNSLIEFLAAMRKRGVPQIRLEA